MSDLGRKIIHGTGWITCNRFGDMAIRFVSNLILVRMLEPEDFGTVGVLTIFITVSDLLVYAGFGSALIQKREPTQTDYSTIFYWNLLSSLLMYVVLWCIAPFVAGYFNVQILSSILRVLGLTIIIGAFVNVQYNRLSKKLDFKTICLINLAAQSGGSVIAIIAACRGFGVWSLVVQQLATGLIRDILMWSLVRWYPSRCFSSASLRTLFQFGGYLFGAGLLHETIRNFQSVIIGRRFSIVEVGLYTQAERYSSILRNAVPGIVYQIMFPVYSSIQDDAPGMQAMLGRNLRMIAFVVCPMLFLLILIATPLIHFLYGSKWDDAVPYFQILCVSGLFGCLQNSNFTAVAAMGKSRQLFWWSFYKWGILLLLLLAGAHWGDVKGVLWGYVASSLNVWIVNAFLTARYVGYAFWRQVGDILPVIATGAAGFGAGVAVQAFVADSYCLISAGVFLFLYLSATFLLRLNVLHDLNRIRQVVLLRRK